MSSKEELLKRLSDGVFEMEEDDVAEAAQEYLDAGYPAFDGIMDGLVDGMNRASEMYEQFNGNKKKAQKVVEIEKSLTDNYRSLTYIKWDELPFPEYEKKVEKKARDKNWTYDLVKGKNTLLKKLVDGEWDEENFLFVPPKQYVIESYDEDVITVMTEKG